MKKLLLIPVLTLLFLFVTIMAIAEWKNVQLTADSSHDYSPQINANGHVVWKGPGGSDGGGDHEIFYYDGTSVTQLTTNSVYESSPQISDNGNVVWYARDENDYEIFYYDGTNVTQLTTNSSN
jgi:Tol biopolymer transport system component